MIFATVGTQLPFPRLMNILDRFAASSKIRIVAQTGDPGFKAMALELYVKLPPEEFDRFFGEAELIVAHAGIGSILSAQRHLKPIVLVPRLARLGEHRNEHQLATVKQLSGRVGIYPAATEAELLQLISDRKLLQPPAKELLPSKINLINALSRFVNSP